MKKTIAITILLILFLNYSNAQPKKGEFINTSIGLGITGSDEKSDIGGSGFYAQGEYVFGLKKWFGFRPYAGIIITSPDKVKEGQPDYEVTSKAFLIGGKSRIVAPIPYFAPYFEIGIGASIGSFKTYTPETNIKLKKRTQTKQ